MDDDDLALTDEEWATYRANLGKVLLALHDAFQCCPLESHDTLAWIELEVSRECVKADNKGVME